MILLSLLFTHEVPRNFAGSCGLFSIVSFGWRKRIQKCLSANAFAKTKDDFLVSTVPVCYVTAVREGIRNYIHIRPEDIITYPYHSQNLVALGVIIGMQLLDDTKTDQCLPNDVKQSSPWGRTIIFRLIFLSDACIFMFTFLRRFWLRKIYLLFMHLAIEIEYRQL